MTCIIGRVRIGKNEGTIIFGNVINNSSNGSSSSDAGSTASPSGKISIDDSRFNLTIPIKSEKELSGN